MEVLIEKKTGAETTDPIFIRASAIKPVRIQVDGALAANEIAVSLIGIDGTAATDAYAGGSAMVLSASIPDLEFTSPIRLKLVKGVTTNAVGVMLLK